MPPATRNARITALACLIALVVAVAFASRKKSRGPAFEVEQLEVGVGHACVLMKDGSVLCWGWNDAGELGPDAPRRQSIRLPVRSTAPPETVAVAVGGGLTCFRIKDGQVTCWGAHRVSDEDSSRAVPFDFGKLHGVVDLGVTNAFGCARLRDGRVQCWGDNRERQLGVEEPRWWADRPVDVPGISGAKALAVGAEHACAIDADDHVFCWGGNKDAQLGESTYEERRGVVRVPGISGAIRIAVGYGRTCVVLGDRTVRCWGNNDRRELGDGTALDRASPVRVLGLEGVREISLGETHACALREDGTVQCWGSGAHRVKIYGVADVQEVHAGGGFTCARMRDRSVKCWGNDHYGLLGDGTTVDTDAPVLVKL